MYGCWNLLYSKCTTEKESRKIMVNFYIGYQFFTWPQQGPLISSLKATSVFLFSIILQMFSFLQWNEHYFKIQNVYMLPYVSPQIQEDTMQIFHLECRLKPGIYLCLFGMLNEDITLIALHQEAIQIALAPKPLAVWLTIKSVEYCFNAY